MKSLYLLVLGLSISTLSIAQSFTYSPSADVADTIMEGAGSSLDIYIGNEDTTDITYGWLLVSNSIPESWFTSLCDWPNCFAGIPDSGVMNTITVADADSGIQGFFKLTLSAGSAPDTATVQLYVYDITDLNRGDTISFSYISFEDTSSSTGIASKESNHLAIFPNPSDNIVTVGASGINRISIYDMAGSIIRNDVYRKVDKVDMNVSNLNSGLYFIRTESEAGTIQRSFIKL